MRKLILLIAAFMAFRGGRGMAKSGRAAASTGNAAGTGLGFGSLLTFWFAPRWLRPIMLARAVRRPNR